MATHRSSSPPASGGSPGGPATAETGGLDAPRRRTLRAVADTVVPSIRVGADPEGYWARSASDLGVDEILARVLAEDVPPPERLRLVELLDRLGRRGFAEAGQARRERMLADEAAASPAGAAGVAFFQKATLLFFYGLPERPPADPQAVVFGHPAQPNPNWPVLGYPGPVTVPPHRPKAIRPLAPEGDRLELEADACVVGSGAGGAVVAARLAEQGLAVVVLEQGGQYNASDFHQLELWSYKNLWYRGGATLTDDGSVNLLAGATLGGGTEINWMNCIRTPDLIRRDWVERFGLEGVDSAEYDRYLDRVEERLLVNGETALFNDQNLRMREGCQRLGYRTERTRINWDPETFQSLLAGYTGLGDQTGAKRTARRTFLLDAYRDGARFLVHTRAERVLHRGGRATGVEATCAPPGGGRTRIVVHAPHVVVAGGALESPALLLRSGIGGPAVGRHLHVQPGGAVYGVYRERQRDWWGSPMTANCEEFVDLEDGYGFYMEIPAFAPGFYASVIPWSSGRRHKELMLKVPYLSTFIWFLRDRGSGRVTLDDQGRTRIVYPLDDPLDRRHFRRAVAEAIRIHAAAGAREILFARSDGTLSWHAGGRRSLEAFVAETERQPLGGGAQPVISAHQLSTCRLGRDPEETVANTDGELRDVSGVWIGDASACPTSLGANPMITIMALAERTATRILARTGRAAVPAGDPERGYVPSARYVPGRPAAAAGAGAPWGAAARGMLDLAMLPWRLWAAAGESLLRGAPADAGRNGRTDDPRGEA